jgi:CRISPR-associated protein Csx10
MSTTVNNISLNIGVQITVETGLSVGAGGSSGGLANKSVVRDAENRLLIPASHLKGRLRHACETLALAAGYAVCGGPRASDLCPQPALKGTGLANVDGQPNENKFCIICQLFGAPAYPSPLQFNDLLMNEPIKYGKADRVGLHGLTAIRPGVSINRQRGVAEDQRLYYTETTRPGLNPVFQNEQAISGLLPLLEDGPKQAEYEKLLASGLLYLRQWGGGKTRGLGWASLKFNISTPLIEVPTDFKWQFELKPKASKPLPTLDGPTEFILTLVALSPLSLSDRRPGEQFRRSLEFIPGSVLKGALGGLLQRRDPVLFNKLFVSPEAQFGNIFGHALPAYKNSETNQGYQVAFRVPFTARECKDKHENHGYFDTLLDLLAYEIKQKKQSGLVYSPQCQHFVGQLDNHVDPTCSGRTENLSGWLKQSEIDNADGGKLRYRGFKSPKTRLLTRVGINRKRAAAEDNLLYSPSVLNEKSLFQARIRIENPTLAQDLYKFLDAIGEFRVGGGISRGLGRVKILHIEAKSTEVLVTDIEKRVKDFNEAMEKRFKEAWNIETVEKPAKTFFTLTAHSELDLGAWDNSFDPTEALAAFDITDVKLERSFVGVVQRSGWSNAWGLPRDTRLLVASGSVFVLSVASATADTAFYAKLARLERVGLGEGQAEGLGVVKVCDQFHYEALWRKLEIELEIEETQE